MKLYIRNMVCDRCKMVVKAELEKKGLHPVSVELGEVELKEDHIDPVKDDLSAGLSRLGFEIIDDRKTRTIERIKNLIIDLVQNKNGELHTNLSDYLSQSLNQDYAYLSNLFSSVEGRTIEKYFIAHKIEKVKELLVYDELSLSEIASRLNYSSVAYLSNQFKKITGLPAGHFKKMAKGKRKSLDEV